MVDYNIDSPEKVKKYYVDKTRIEKYIAERFGHPLGAVLHEIQVKFVNYVIKEYGITEILEFAPGPARISVELKGFQRGVMVDYSEGMLKVAKKRILEKGICKDWFFINADIFRLELKKKFDLVYSFRFIRHLRKSDRMKVYQKAKEFLKPDGLFIFDAVNYEVSHPLRERHPAEYPVYDKLYKKEELSAEMEKNGFDVLEMKGVYCCFKLQSFLNDVIPSRFFALTRFLIKCLENRHTSNPLEWIVLCRKR